MTKLNDEAIDYILNFSVPEYLGYFLPIVVKQQSGFVTWMLLGDVFDVSLGRFDFLLGIVLMRIMHTVQGIEQCESAATF